MSFIESYLAESAAILGKLDVPTIQKLVTSWSRCAPARAACSSSASAAAPATRPTP